MTNDICRFVTLAVASVTVPASRAGTCPAGTHLAAIGMLIAERGPDHEWHFTIETGAIGAGDSEDVLLRWAATAMPDTGIVIGWQLADAVIAPLLDAGASGDPELGRVFLDRLTKLTTALSVELAAPYGGAGAPPLAEILGARDIECAAIGDADVESAWAFGNTAWLRDYVSAQVIAAWKLWLADGNGTTEAASAAFATWLANRS
ncbi:MAG: hypothetical protein J0J06_13870 [Sphingomonas sp.]|uniref:hypothetical protein n=1 Tax=Sphingomonas sp. TaxID=28214 RepID=UPI001AC0A925|nr:hypothetical protein [Sphingomonas sp.]MBN8816522.1 hypothetical protein [Sphingomonas sp.]